MNTRLAVVTGLVLVLGTGCGYRGAQSLPLPGGTGGDGYEITVEVPDASNLVPRETCRINDVVVGSVRSVRLTDDLRARIVCRIKDGVRVPGNAQAVLKETSLLGERFVSLDPPPGEAPDGVLRPGATLTENTRTDPNVETVLAALSQVVNGGSLGSLGTITRELGTALRESDLAATIERLGSTSATLQGNQDAIDRALAGLDSLFARLATQRDSIDAALDSIPAGIAALDRQRPALVRTLTELERLAGTARPLIRDSRDATVADLKALVPTLRGLDQVSEELALTLERVGTFPFPSNAIEAVKNGYTGFNGTILLDLDMVASLLRAAVADSRLQTKLPAAAATPAVPPGSSPLETLLGGLLGSAGNGSEAGSDATGPEDLSGLLGSLLGGGQR